MGDDFPTESLQFRFICATFRGGELKQRFSFALSHACSELAPSYHRMYLNKLTLGIYLHGQGNPVQIPGNVVNFFEGSTSPFYSIKMAHNGHEGHACGD